MPVPTSTNTDVKADDMTKQEADRIDALYQEIIEWRREDSDRLLAFKGDIIAATSGAVEAHRMDCIHGRLDPMGEKLDWLYDNARKRCAEAGARNRVRKQMTLLAGGVCTAIGIATPFILHWL